MERRGITGGARSTWRPAPWLATALVVILIAGGLPLAWLMVVAIGQVGSIGSVLSPRMLLLLANTVLLGTLVSVLTGFIGTLLGLLLTKTDVRGRRMLLALLTFPLLLPPYLLALGWFSVLGRGGLLAAAFGSGVGVLTSDTFFGLTGAVLVLTIAHTPIVMHLVAIALRMLDPATEEAARLRFGWPRVLWRIDLQLIAPAVALGMLLTFILVIGEFGVPAYLRYAVFSGAVFTQFAAFLNVQTAVVTSIPLAVVVIGAVVVERIWLRERVQFLGRVRMVPLAASLGSRRTATSSGVWAYALLTVVLPLAGLVIEAGGGRSYLVAFSGASSSIVGSLWTAATAATVMLVLGLLLSYLVERAGRGRRDGVDTALLLLFAAPGTVLGVALILLWNRAGLTPFYASSAIVIIGYVAHYTPLAARTLGVALQALSPAVEDAARLAGVSWMRTVRGVLLPLLTPALASAWLLAFVFCLRDLDLVMTIHPPGFQTLPVRVYTLMANSPGPVTAALALLIVMLTLAVVLAAGVGHALVRRATAWT